MQHHKPTRGTKKKKTIFRLTCNVLQCNFFHHQVQWMGEKLKASDSPSGDSEVQLFQRCQHLQVSVQEKEEVITQLAQQLEEQVSNYSQ